MNKRLRRAFMMCVATLLLIQVPQNLKAQVLHQITEKEIVSTGVELISEEILTNQGWQDVHMLKVDLNNPWIQIAPMESSVLGERKDILTLAKETGAIAGINADFFDMGNSTGPSFGPVINNEGLKQSYNMHYVNLGPKKHMATFLMNKNNDIFMDYYGIQTRIEKEGHKLFDVASINKLLGTLSRPIVLDRSYYENTMKARNKYQKEGVYSIVVEDGEVTYISTYNESLAIPQDGFVILMNTTYANQFMQDIKIGDSLECINELVLSNEVISSLEDMEAGIGGGGLIMKDGMPYSGASHMVSGDKKEPRSVVATTYTPGEVLLIAVDGRLNTLGMNHEDLVHYLKQHGVKDAMYFDGGGSTTLVARETGSHTINVQNKPSGGFNRKVVNGLGIYSTAQTGTLSKLYLESSTDRTFVDEGITFSVSGVDENDNPVLLEESNLKYSVAGVNGYWEGMTFYPTSHGTALVMVSNGNVTATKEVYVSAKPRGLMIEPSKMQIDPNTTKKVQVYGVDSAGYKIPIQSENIIWTSDNDQVVGEGHTIIAKEEAVATLTATYKGATGQLGVVVGNSIRPIDSLEEVNAVWAGDTTQVQGTVEPSKEVKYHGDQALKMTYTFDKSPNKQVAYTVFKTPIGIPKDAYALNLWVYAKGQKDPLKVQIKDANGKYHYLKVTDALTHEGWKYLSTELPEEVALPAQLTKIYTYSTANSEKRTSAIYLDHLSISRGHQKQSGISIRDDYRFDPMYKPSLQAPVGNQYQIKVTGPTKSESMILDEKTKDNIKQNLEEHSEMIIQGSGNQEAFDFNKLTYSYNNAFSTALHKEIQTVFVGTNKGGIRQTNSEQWLQVKETIENTTADHILLIMSQNPLTQFKDSREGIAFHNYLEDYKNRTGKTIFVITSGGSENEVRIEEGIRYIRLNGVNVPNDSIAQGTYLTFKVVGNQIYYTFETMLK